MRVTLWQGHDNDKVSGVDRSESLGSFSVIRAFLHV
jgi:hypothetical protein